MKKRCGGQIGSSATCTLQSPCSVSLSHSRIWTMSAETSYHRQKSVKDTTLAFKGWRIIQGFVSSAVHPCGISTSNNIRASGKRNFST